MAKENKYGEKTKMVNYRVPESKVAEINQMVKLKLNEYEKDVLMLSERQFSETPLEVIPKWKQVLKESTDITYSVPDTKPKFTPNATKNEVNMDALRAIANGEGVKSELFASKKKPIDEEYDCIEVTRGIPDILDRVYASAKSDVAFWDRNDATVFYVVWESKCYRFVNNGQFNKFLKDNNIK